MTSRPRCAVAKGSLAGPLRWTKRRHVVTAPPDDINPIDSAAGM